MQIFEKTRQNFAAKLPMRAAFTSFETRAKCQNTNVQKKRPPRPGAAKSGSAAVLARRGGVPATPGSIHYTHTGGENHMANYRKSRLLNPQAYDAMNAFKMECAAAIGRTQFTKEKNDHYKGDLTARQNGSEGGPIGGEMVRRIFEQYENSAK